MPASGGVRTPGVPSAAPQGMHARAYRETGLVEVGLREGVDRRRQSAETALDTARSFSSAGQPSDRAWAESAQAGSSVFSAHDSAFSPTASSAPSARGPVRQPPGMVADPGTAQDQIPGALEDGRSGVPICTGSVPAPLVGLLERIATALKHTQENGKGVDALGDALAVAPPDLLPPTHLEMPRGVPEAPQASAGAGRHTASTEMPALQVPAAVQLLAKLEERVACLEGGFPSVHSHLKDFKDEMSRLRARTDRLECEVSELRAQVMQRLDAAQRDAAACRRDAEQARVEAVAARKEVTEIIAHLYGGSSGMQPSPTASLGGPLHGSLLAGELRSTPGGCEATASSRLTLGASAPMPSAPGLAEAREPPPPELRGPDLPASAAPGRWSSDRADFLASPGGTANAGSVASVQTAETLERSPAPCTFPIAGSMKLVPQAATADGAEKRSSLSAAAPDVSRTSPSAQTSAAARFSYGSIRQAVVCGQPHPPTGGIARGSFGKSKG